MTFDDAAWFYLRELVIFLVASLAACVMSPPKMYPSTVDGGR